MTTNRRDTVMFVDPFVDEREMFTDYLRAVGFRVIAVSSAEAARRAIADDVGPGVVVLRGWSASPSSDYFMLARELRQSHVTRDIPTILLTTDGFSDQTLATEAGCDVVFLLPVSLDDVQKAIHQLRDRTHRTVA